MQREDGEVTMAGELVSTVRRLQARMDDAIREWRRTYEGEGGRLYCARGCRNCCRLAVHATYPEALAMAQALTPTQADVLCGYVEGLRSALREASDFRSYLREHRRLGRFCPFLDAQGACGLYEVRPFSCRSLLSTRNPDYCGIDLSALHPLEKEAFLSSLDPAVVAFPTHYAAAPQSLGRDLEGAALAEMAKRCGFTLSGNVAVLVWLIREGGLADAARQGGDAVAMLLEGEGLSSSYLLELGRGAAPAPPVNPLP